jgi:hypothetical protein
MLCATMTCSLARANPFALQQPLSAASAIRGFLSPQCRSMSSHGLKRVGRSKTAPIAMTHEFRTTPRMRHMMIVMMGDLNLMDTP